MAEHFTWIIWPQTQNQGLTQALLPGCSDCLGGHVTLFRLTNTNAHSYGDSPDAEGF